MLSRSLALSLFRSLDPHPHPHPHPHTTPHPHSHTHHRHAATRITHYSSLGLDDASQAIEHLPCLFSLSVFLRAATLRDEVPSCAATDSHVRPYRGTHRHREAQTISNKGS